MSEDVLKDYIGKRVIVLYMSHNTPDVRVELGTLEKANDCGIHLKDTINLQPIASDFIFARKDKPWCGTWIPLDGYAKVLTVIDKESEKIIYTKEWNIFQLAWLFAEDEKKIKAKPNYGKPWDEVPKIDMWKKRNHNRC